MIMMKNIQIMIIVKKMMIIKKLLNTKYKKMIKQSQDRSKLSEGRNRGMGFSILKKNSDNNFETYMAHTACKDYLNDLVYVENTNVNITQSIHGFKHKKQNIFDKKRFFYLSLCALDINNSSGWKLLKNFSKALYSNIDMLIYHINILEDYLNLGAGRTTLENTLDIENYNHKGIILKTPTYWAKTPILLSFLCLYIRCVFHLDKKLTINEIFNVNLKPFLNDDIYMKETLNTFIKIKNPKKYFLLYKYDETINSLSKIHNYGIISWLKKVNAYVNGLENIKKCW